MGELTNFLGNETVRIIPHNAAETINEFKNKSPATNQHQLINYMENMKFIDKEQQY